MSEIEECAIAVDATYYIQLLLDNPPSHEPLLPALGGLTGIRNHIENNLDQWAAAKVTPFFIFDGQSVTGQDEVTVRRGRRANDKTNLAWELYFSGQAQNAVQTFGQNVGAFRPQSLYPLLQEVLHERTLHFLVAPYNAAAQIAYFDMIDSDQCAGIMGSHELLLYPIKDSIIKSIDFEARDVTAISKRQMIKALNVGEHTFIDAFLMTGTSFLPSFPPLLDTNIVPRQASILEAVNLLRTSEKSMANACASFNDILQAQDPTWLDKYRKARMTINHFIYVAETGEIKTNDFEKLTSDNHTYLGLQLPAELFHYANTGLIGSRPLSWMTNSQILVQPTLDGVASEEYRRLITSQLLPIRETTLALLIPRLHRGIQHSKITMKVWWDNRYSYTLNTANIQPSPPQRAATWVVKATALNESSHQGAPGSIAFELLALQNADFARATISSEKPKGLDTADAIISVTIWRLLHFRGYVNDSHELTPWGQALSKSFAALEPTVKSNPDVPYLYESLLVAFELIRFDLLNAKNKHEELHGLPMNGSDDDKASLLLVSRCATMLKLRHEANGYTGPLSKNLLAFHSLISAVRETDRDLTEAIVASMFMYGQAKKERDDGFEISHR